MFVDYNAASRFVIEVCSHYEQSAPTVAAWADDLYMRMSENTAAVSLHELLQLQYLFEEGVW